MMILDSIQKFTKETLDHVLDTKSLTQKVPYLVPVDLNDFISSPNTFVNPSGNHAIILQNSFSPSVFLEHNPVFDPVKIIPGNGRLLNFNYKFEKTQKSKDEFGAFLLDKFGTPLGLPFEFFTENSSKGTVSFDLSSLTFEPVGLVFVLTKIDSICDTNDSLVEISNVQVAAKSNPKPNKSLLRKELSKTTQNISYNNLFS